MDGHRSVRRHNVAHTWHRGGLDGLRERNSRVVHDGIDSILELDDERGVARCNNPERIHASARRSF